mmetsp:Transcript_14172/g.18568  ORF Transcript_14172/g.18568 Transcript_14172/m.18568 type:complete len:92 (+) Transcript_14172:804-1079(+)
MQIDPTVHKAQLHGPQQVAVIDPIIPHIGALSDGLLIMPIHFLQLQACSEQLHYNAKEFCEWGGGRKQRRRRGLLRSPPTGYPPTCAEFGL